jgi:hypothetical protein
MKIEPVILWLQQNLPLYTSLFSDTVSVTSLENNSGIVTATTSSAHNFVNGQLINIGGAFVPNNLVSLTRVNNIGYGTTQTNHDLTQGWQPNITISGADQAEYNGTFPLLTVPNRRNFSFQLPDDSAPTPATGTPQLIEFRPAGYNGYFPIVVISPTQFSYEAPVGNELNATGSIVASSNTRISGAASIERAIDAYTKQGIDRMWMIVVSGPTRANNDRNTKSDATAQFSKTDQYWQRLIESLSVYVICSTTSGITARRERDLVEDEVMYSLLEVMCGTKFTNNFPVNKWARMVFVGHDIFEYNSSYYIHKFDFETQTDLSFNFLLLPFTTAFRDISLNFLENDEFESPTIMTAHVDLDDEPLE